MTTKLDSKIPEGPVAEKWSNYKAHQRLVNPKNKLKLDVIVVGTGLAGASAAASLAEMGFNVKNFCIQDSPRRAHSIAAQGGINAAKNYQNDGDSVYRLFYDTVKGGDYRAREANVLCKGTDRSAASARSLLSPLLSGKRRQSTALHTLRNARRSNHRRTCSRYHRQEPRNW